MFAIEFYLSAKIAQYRYFTNKLKALKTLRDRSLLIFGCRSSTYPD